MCGAKSTFINAVSSIRVLHRFSVQESHSRNIRRPRVEGCVQVRDVQKKKSKKGRKSPESRSNPSGCGPAQIRSDSPAQLAALKNREFPESRRFALRGNGGCFAFQHCNAACGTGFMGALGLIAQKTGNGQAWTGPGTSGKKKGVGNLRTLSSYRRGDSRARRHFRGKMLFGASPGARE